jgi:hypothetical protein
MEVSEQGSKEPEPIEESETASQNSVENESTIESGNQQTESDNEQQNQASGLPDLSSISQQPPKESGKFMWADLNKDSWISPDEVLHFIDLLFEGEAIRTVEDIQDLIDYYFDQD